MISIHLIFIAGRTSWCISTFVLSISNVNFTLLCWLGGLNKKLIGAIYYSSPIDIAWELVLCAAEGDIILYKIHV